MADGATLRFHTLRHARESDLAEAALARSSLFVLINPRAYFEQARAVRLSRLEQDSAALRYCRIF